MYVSFGEEGENENAANAALRLILTRVARVHLDMGPYYNMLGYNQSAHSSKWDKLTRIK